MMPSIMAERPIGPVPRVNSGPPQFQGTNNSGMQNQGPPGLGSYHQNDHPPFEMPNTSLPPPGMQMQQSAESFTDYQVAQDREPPQRNSTLDNGELWVETKSSDGKSYFYNAKTRESAWSKPEGVRIVTQEEFMRMSMQPPPVQNHESAHGPGDGEAPFGDGMPMGGQRPPFSGPRMNMPPPGMPPFMMRPPFLPPRGMAPPGMPPTNFPPGFPPRFPSQSMPPLMDVPPGGAPHAPSAGQDELGFQLHQLRMQASCWTSHRTADGRLYFYNSATSESVWEKPKLLADIEDLEKQAQSQKESAPPPVQPQAPMNGGVASAVSSLEQELMELQEVGRIGDWPPSLPPSLQAKELMPKVEEKKRDPTRPAKKIPVTGTPWCVVWTGDSRVFFFNPSSKISLWQRPEELRGRKDVDELVSKMPSDADEKKKKAAKLDEEPTLKKLKLEMEENMKEKEEALSFLNSGPISIGKEAAIEAEAKAARERANLPLETRMEQFRLMLAEKEVSAFSTWEKELHKIVFDPRYLLLTSKERKQVFDQHVKERAEEERKERAAKLKQKKDEYKELLKEAKITSRTSFSEFAGKYGREERFKGIEKMREREHLFTDFIHALKRRDKEDKFARKERVKTEFMELLKEQKSLGVKSSWNDVKKNIDSDSRYKAVESSTKREEWFKDHIKGLKGNVGEETVDDGEKERRKEAEKQRRIEESLKEREKVVKEQLSSSLKERDKERDNQRKEEAVENFKALLADMVRSTDMTWKETRRGLRKDHRWDLCTLSKQEKEELFDEHLKVLNKKKRDAFHQLLFETSQIDLTSTWKDVRKLIKNDPRFDKFSSSDRKREQEFYVYLDERLQRAQEEFRQLLKETKAMNYKSKSLLAESDQHMRDIEAFLENDKRYLILECKQQLRQKILMDYVDELARKGPPPPPTQAEPSRRK